MTASQSLDDLLDSVVSEYSDALAAGRRPARADFLHRVPAAARPGLERVLKMIEAGTAATPSPARPLAAGLVLGGFELSHEIGRGGMAVVWLARDTELERPVALKILRPGLALESRHVDRFRREALAIARLKHPHIVSIYGVGEDYGYHWLAMEYVEGPSLATLLEALPTDRPRTAEDLARAAGVASLVAGAPVAAHEPASFERAIARLLAPVADALGTAHAAGLVHRDVKPSNILIHRDGRAVIADFGLAKGDGDPALSLTGEGLGTPYYMSPEQAYLTSKSVDHRTDVYSLGVTLYEALSGARPFSGESFLEVVESIRSTAPEPLRARRPECSRDAAALTRRAMARDPEHRYENAAALKQDLIALSEGQPTHARLAEGGPIRRTLSQMRRAGTGENYEFVSETKWLGRPLIHICSAGRRGPGIPRRHARGWIAMGDVAHGILFAGGQVAYSAGIATGGIAVGTVAWGGLAAGILSSGGLALGAIVFAGVGLGWLAFGGVATGYASIGGVAIGKYAMGGKPIGTHTVGESGVDPAGEAFFEQLFSSVSGFFSALFGG